MVMEESGTSSEQEPRRIPAESYLYMQGTRPSHRIAPIIQGFVRKGSRGLAGGFSPRTFAFPDIDEQVPSHREEGGLIMSKMKSSTKSLCFALLCVFFFVSPLRAHEEGATPGKSPTEVFGTVHFATS